MFAVFITSNFIIEIHSFPKESIKMPIYEYKCTKCQKIIEKIIAASKRDDLQECPDCHGVCERKMSLVARKGGGGNCAATSH